MQFTSLKEKDLGFTLIELLISLVIGGLLLVAGLAAYRGFGEKQSVKQAGVTFQTNLKLAQQKALSGEKPIECMSGDRLQGYRVTYEDADSYSVQAVCETAVPLATMIDLDDEVEFLAVFSPMEIYFPVLTSEVIGAQTITLFFGSYSYEVVIGSSGVIKGQLL